MAGNCVQYYSPNIFNQRVVWLIPQQLLLNEVPQSKRAVTRRVAMAMGRVCNHSL